MGRRRGSEIDEAILRKALEITADKLCGRTDCYFCNAEERCKATNPVTALTEVEVVETIRRVAHPCKSCEWDDPPIVCEGEVVGDQIMWPVFSKYRIGYCPHCGQRLPLTLKQLKARP